MCIFFKFAVKRALKQDQIVHIEGKLQVIRYFSREYTDKLPKMDIISQMKIIDRCVLEKLLLIFTFIYTNSMYISFVLGICYLFFIPKLLGHQTI